VLAVLALRPAPGGQASVARPVRAAGTVARRVEAPVLPALPARVAPPEPETVTAGRPQPLRELPLHRGLAVTPQAASAPPAMPARRARAPAPEPLARAVAPAPTA